MAPAPIPVAVLATMAELCLHAIELWRPLAIGIGGAHLAVIAH